MRIIVSMPTYSMLLQPLFSLELHIAAPKELILVKSLEE
jgi:hypothetical protein